MNQGSRNRDFLLFSSTESLDIWSLDRRKIDDRLYCIKLSFDLSKRNTFKQKRIDNIFLRSHGMNQLIILKHRTNLSPISLDLCIRKFCHIFQLVKNRLFRSSQLPNKKFYQSRLSWARLPCYDKKISLVELKIKLVKKLSLAIRIGSS